METRGHAAAPLEGRTQSKVIMTERNWPGKFVTVEGGDGSGKSTQAELIVAHAASLGVDVVGTKEPGGIPETFPFRERIFDSRLSENGGGQLLLFGAERVVHLAVQVLPDLLDGKLVVCDRFSGSTFAYQHERGVPLRTIMFVDRIARTVKVGGKETQILPDLTVLVDVPAQVGIERMARRKGETTYFDADDVTRHERRRIIFLELARRFGWVVVDGARDKEEVFIDVLTTLEERGILPKG